jgi:RNA polymerase sigma-70 factor, ECF subfamily
VSESLQLLIRSATSGDGRAFAELHARYAGVVHAFLVAWKKLGQLEEPEGFGAWLCAIARNRAVDCQRRRRPTEVLQEGWPDDRSASSSDAAEVRHVLDAIRSLPEAYRETLVMRLCEGMSGPEIATATGLEPGSVRINLHRGMKLLRERLGVDGKVAS